MEFSATQIAELLGGTIEGDPNATVSNLSKIEEGKPNTLSFLANPKYTEFIYDTDASIVIVADDFNAERPVKDTCTLIRVQDAYGSFAKLLGMYNQIKGDKKGIDASASVSESAELGEDVYVGGNAHVGDNCKIGANVKIYPTAFIGDNTVIGDNTIVYGGARIYSDCVVGKDCVIHGGAVIGGDGFGFAPSNANNYEKVPQIGNVILEDHVEIGANTTIDRATLGSTIIRKGVKLDNLIQVAHNVEIGEHTVIAAQTGIAGSTKIGKDCMIGGQVGIIGHLKIGDGVKIAAQSGIGHDLEDNVIVQGSPAFGIGDYKKSYLMFRKLPEMEKRLWALEKDKKEQQ